MIVSISHTHFCLFLHLCRSHTPPFRIRRNFSLDIFCFSLLYVHILAMNSNHTNFECSISTVFACFRQVSSKSDSILGVAFLESKSEFVCFCIRRNFSLDIFCFSLLYVHILAMNSNHTNFECSISTVFACFRQVSSKSDSILGVAFLESKLISLLILFFIGLQTSLALYCSTHFEWSSAICFACFRGHFIFT